MEERKNGREEGRKEGRREGGKEGRKERMYNIHGLVCRILCYAILCYPILFVEYDCSRVDLLRFSLRAFCDLKRVVRVST